jgi:serine protease Do
MKKLMTNMIPQTRAGMIALAAAVAVLALTTRHVIAGDTPRATPVTLTVNEAPVLRDTGGTGSFAPVVKRVAQSVVRVNIVTKSKTIDAPANQMDGEEMLRRFFGPQFGMPRGQMRTPRQEGLGSGVIVNKDGYILTNNHVVEQADTIKVVLNDGREFTAKIVGRDPKTDIAVVKIEAKDLPFITISDSDKLEVGDVCLAIGNPFGFGQTVTMGIISAMGRGNLGLGTDYEDFIQTDAAINPGNSGGALVDTQGRLIGINTAIYSRSGGYQGIGFAVPINLARNVMQQLIEHGKVVRGFMGVNIQDVNRAIASKFNIPENQGALVDDVSPQSPAEKAGLRSGDVIVEYNNKPIADSRHLKLQVAETTPGTVVPLKVYREGDSKTVYVTVKELPGSDDSSTTASKQDNSNESLNGVTVGDIDPNVRRQMNLPAKVGGALVMQVDEDSSAAEAGLRVGDVIEEINREPVKNAEDAVRLTENLKDKVILLRVYSSNNGSGASHYIVVDESGTK